MWEIRQVIHRTGHRYHKEKAFIDKPAKITGVFVDGEKLTVPHRQFRKARLAKAAIASVKGSEAMREATQQLAGLEGQIRQIRAAADQMIGPR